MTLGHVLTRSDYWKKSLLKQANSYEADSDHLNQMSILIATKLSSAPA
jgi:hypothetical protein